MKKVMFLLVVAALLIAQAAVADVIVSYGQRARVYDEATWTPISTEYDLGDSHWTIVGTAFLSNGNVALSYIGDYSPIPIYSYVGVFQPSTTGAWTQVKESSNWGTPIKLDAMSNGDLLFQWQGVAGTFDPSTMAQTSPDINYTQWGYNVPDAAATYDGRVLVPYNIAPSYGYVAVVSVTPTTWQEDTSSQNLTPVLKLDSMPNGDVLVAHGASSVERYVQGTPSWTAPYGSMSFYPAVLAEFAGMPDGRVVVAYNDETNTNFRLSTMSMNTDGSWNNDATSANFSVPLTSVSAKRSGLLTGQIELLDYQGDLSLLPVRVELIPQGSGTAKTVEFKLATNPSTYSVVADSGTYNLVFSSGKCLQALVSGVTVSFGSVTVVGNVALVNGDVDGSLGVDSTDLSAVLKAM